MNACHSIICIRNTVEVKSCVQACQELAASTQDIVAGFVSVTEAMTTNT